jgi:uncharacterized protein (TIGR02145 family)
MRIYPSANLSISIRLGLVVICTALFVNCSDNSTGTSSPSVPSVSTGNISAITSTTASCGGTIISDGGAAVTARGVCWSTAQSPTVSDDKTNDGSGNGSFTSAMSGLTPSTTYYVRAYATNSVGTGYGDSGSFVTLEGATSVTDVDGNVYQTVKIDNQRWMVQNLKVTHYRNGDSISNVTDNGAWTGLSTGAYACYDNDTLNTDTYGLLYNWHAVDDGRNIAPEGWHVPTAAEWDTLITHLGGVDAAGGAMKETGTEHWLDPNTGATNSSGFTALPGGFRSWNSGAFSTLGSTAWFWTTTDYDPGAAWNYDISNTYSSISRDGNYKRNGMSVRCVQD